MHIEPVSPASKALPLLVECQLPTTDISLSIPPQFFGSYSGGSLVAVVGLEAFAQFGLLRSLAVAPSFRSQGLARKLVAFVELHAAHQGIKQMFLLTTTAERFFMQLGYAVASRSAAPPAIQGTSQFSGLCPASSAFLCKHIGTTRVRFR